MAIIDKAMANIVGKKQKKSIDKDESAWVLGKRIYEEVWKINWERKGESKQEKE